ncbi:MAG: ABC transporter permease [Trueperaceae bacterium]|nr:ABC transporter permease [Trueperaceae bacterium]
MSERLAVAAFALVTLVALWVAPWAAFSRETGSRAAVILLPDRVIDFTGRTDPISVPGQGAVLWLSVAGLVVVAGGAALSGRARHVAWLAAGALLIGTATWGLAQFDAAVEARRAVAFQEAIAPNIADPRPNQDAERLRQLSEEALERPVTVSVELAREAGVVVRRLPYGGSAPGFAAFLTLVVGAAALLFGLRVWPRAGRVLDRVLTAVAIPAVSIALALLAAAVVILLLQPTPVGRDVVVAGPLMALAGRLDTLWHAYYILFSGSLGTVKGFFDALSFATPLIFTGLAVGFGFRAGLFNIGAPGQMVLGAIGAMFVGLYLPGPAWVVLPAAVLVAAVGGGLWGAIPGFLKARFGANEVINTILLNFVAASLMLFMLSSSPTFAASAVRVIQLIAWVVAASLVGLLVPPVRRAMRISPRLTLALVAVIALVGAVVVAQPRAGDQPVVLQLPFKAPGSEPKSYELSEAARIPRLPAMFGIDLRATPGTNVVPVDAAAWIAGLLAVLVFVGAGAVGALRRRGFQGRILAALGVAAVAYATLAAVGWRALPLAIPPTNLNPSFLIALAAAVFVWVFLFRTRYGYELRATGLAPKAAEYGGANIPRNTVMAMAISGALAGLTATHYVLGGALEDYALRQSLPTGDGFDGIAVALLGANHPVGTVLAAFLFGVLKNGGSAMNIAFTDLTRDVVSMVLALVVLFIAAKGFLPDWLTNPLRRAQALGDLPEEPAGGTPPGGGTAGGEAPVIAPQVAASQEDR